MCRPNRPDAIRRVLGAFLRVQELMKVCQLLFGGRFPVFDTEFAPRCLNFFGAVLHLEIRLGGGRHLLLRTEFELPVLLLLPEVVLREVVLRELGFGGLHALSHSHPEFLLEFLPGVDRAGRKDEERLPFGLGVFRVLGSPDEVLLQRDDFLLRLFFRNVFAAFSVGQRFDDFVRRLDGFFGFRLGLLGTFTFHTPNTYLPESKY